MGRPLITSRQIDQTTDLVRARVRIMTGITAKEYQGFLARGGEFQDIVEETIREFIRGRYVTDEVVFSGYAYPPEFTGLKPVRDQVEALMQHFPNLDPTWALEQGQSWYDRLKPEFPDWVEGPLVYIWRGASYHSAVQIVLDKLGMTQKFRNYREGQIDANYLKQTELTEKMENQLHLIQPGSFLIVPSQLGKRYAGSSVRRDRELFIPGEFGHGSLAVSCLALTHPQRFVRWEQLHVDCAGDEFSSRANGVFDYAPCLRSFCSELEFSTRGVRNPYNYYGSMSAFLPACIAAVPARSDTCSVSGE